MAYRIAIGTVDGIEITEHFGRGKSFLIVEIDQQTNGVRELGIIEVVHSENCESGHDEALIQQKLQALLDWRVVAVLVKQIGPRSERLLTKNKIEVLVSDGKVLEALEKVKVFYRRRSFEL